jgi:hypothetical protein
MQLYSILSSKEYRKNQYLMNKPTPKPMMHPRKRVLHKQYPHLAETFPNYSGTRIDKLGRETKKRSRGITKRKRKTLMILHNMPYRQYPTERTSKVCLITFFRGLCRDDGKMSNIQNDMLFSTLGILAGPVDRLKNKILGLVVFREVIPDNWK